MFRPPTLTEPPCGAVGAARAQSTASEDFGIYVFDGPNDSQPTGPYARGARTFPVGEYGLEPGRV